MATSFPSAVQTFPQMIDATSSDGALIAQYQSAMESGNLSACTQVKLRLSTVVKV